MFVVVKRVGTKYPILLVKSMVNYASDEVLGTYDTIESAKSNHDNLVLSI